MLPTDDTRFTRRRFLVAATSAAALGSAGCTSTLPPLDQRPRYGQVDAPDPTDPTFRRWIPAASALPDGVDPDDTGWQYHTAPNQLTDVFGYRLSLPVVVNDVLRVYLDYFGIEFDRIDGITSVGPGAVVDADVDRTTVAETLLDSGYERAGTYQGCDLFGRPDESRLFAVGDEWIVYTTTDPLRPMIETLIDVGHGRRPRRHEVDETFARLTERAGGEPFAMLSNWFMPPPDDLDPDAHALAIRVGEEAAYYVVPSHFPGGPPPVDRLREWVSDWRRGAGVELVDVTTADEWATIEMLLTPESLGERDGPTTLDPPLVTWSVDVDDRTVTIRHEAGGSFPADKLSVRGVDEANVTVSADDRLGPGDTVTLDRSAVEHRLDVSLVYTSDDGSTSLTLFSYTQPDSDTDETEQGG